MTTYALHFLVGLVFAVSGWYARGFCKHTNHRVMLTLILVAVESAATVSIIG